jgi:glutaredoxin
MKPGQMLNVVFYTRHGCHLCDDAAAVLRAHGITYQKVDIDDDPELVERFNTCVPVVEIDGVVRFRGRVDGRLLRRFLR